MTNTPRQHPTALSVNIHLHDSGVTVKDFTENRNPFVSLDLGAGIDLFVHTMEQVHQLKDALSLAEMYLTNAGVTK